MSDRKQLVCVNNFSSRPLNIDVGGAQGRDLGHLRFIPYVNDLLRASNAFKFYPYADDTSATVTSTNQVSAIDTLNEELKIVVEWFR